MSRTIYNQIPIAFCHIRPSELFTLLNAMARRSAAGSSCVWFCMFCVMIMMVEHKAGVRAADADPLMDYCVADLSQAAGPGGYPCKPPASLTPDDFVFGGLASAANASASPFLATATFAFDTDFPAVNTLGLGMARLDFAVGGAIVPHVHPRATEMLYLVSGQVYCAFVDASDVLFGKVLSPGDLIVFPRGLIHFQLNVGSTPAVALVALNSQSPGFQVVATSLFRPNIPDALLRKTFFLDDATLDSIRATFQATFPSS